MKKINKKVLFLVLIILVIISICVEVNANSAKDEATGFIGGTGDYSNATLSKPVKTVMAAVVNAVRVATAGIAVIMLLSVAMKYMSAAPGEKAEIKKSAVIYVVGAFVMFGASGILTIISNLSANI